MLDGGPLVPAHRPGARVGEQVDQDIVGVKVEEVQPGGLHRDASLVPGGHADRLDGVDPERFDDRLPVVHPRTIPPWSGLRPPGGTESSARRKLGMLDRPMATFHRCAPY